MALRKKYFFILSAIFIGFFSLYLLIYSLINTQRIKQFNQHLDAENYTKTPHLNSINEIYVKAYYHHQKLEFEAAVKHYQQIEKKGNDNFQQIIRYNMATLYLQRSLLARQKNEDEISVPLIELSKHLYREVLRENPKNWPAKYNLEQALKLSPELKEETKEEDILPEQSPEATGSMEIDLELP